MKKLLVMALVVMSMLVCNMVALADELPGGSVSFDVKWTVDPMIYFALGFGENFVLFENGTPVLGDPNFSDYVFQTMSPMSVFELYDDPYLQEDVYGAPIFAWVLSNDWWKLQFTKPELVSDNDHTTNVPVYAKRYMANWEGDYSETDWFTGDDLIEQDMGVYSMAWDLKVIFENWHTRYGNYQNTFTFVVTQL